LLGSATSSSALIGSSRSEVVDRFFAEEPSLML
jgi:hypothetical protein